MCFYNSGRLAYYLHFMGTGTPGKVLRGVLLADVGEKLIFGS